MHTNFSENKMKTLEDLKVGDTVWYTDINSRPHGLVTTTEVTKIGSKLIFTSRFIFRKDSMRTNDGYAHETLWLELEAVEREARRKKLERALWSYRGKASLEVLEQVVVLLNITIIR